MTRAIDADDIAAANLDERKAIAADTSHRGLDNTLHCACTNCCIHSIAARTQNADRGLACQRMGRRGSAVDAVDERTSGEMEIATHDETFTSSASQLSEPVAHLDLIFSESTQSAIETTTVGVRSEEHTSELQSLMRISYAVFCLKKN